MAMEKHFIQEGVIRSEIENFLKKELGRTGFSSVNIQKTPTATRVILYIEKPPLVIGKKGKRVNRLTKILTEKYGIDNPTIDVQRVEKPTLDPNIVARRIAVALERGINRRRIAYKALRAIMMSGARGAEIILSGKIVGKGGRSRSEKYSEGYMKKAGDSLRLVDIGSTQANLKAGVIGVTVKLVKPDTVFPDQISIIDRKPMEEKPPEKDMPEKKKRTKKTVNAVKEKKEKEDKKEANDAAAPATDVNAESAAASAAVANQALAVQET
jgi:small subunit ribosomal protein S3